MLVVEEQLPRLCSSLETRALLQEQCSAVKDSHREGRIKPVSNICSCPHAKTELSHWCPCRGLQQYCDALVFYARLIFFYYIYFQVEQPQSPNNDIKSPGIPSQGESMLTRVRTETTCWGRN